MEMIKQEVEIWGGIEGTINRVQDNYFDQCEYSGHYNREDDIEQIASLGIKMLRYPVLWERHQPVKDQQIDWSFVEKNLEKLRKAGVEPIAGLVHHGSGPEHVNFFDGSFEQGVADYATEVAKKFPWLTYYTPINEPLTTARFCGLYGHWYPHKKDALSFYRILLSECRAIVMAMESIRKINPHAKLIQTEDLGKTYSTPELDYQASFENHRRWISYDLLCGKVDESHPLWEYLLEQVGLTEEELNYFSVHNCPPDICGFNYYITSERYLDEDLSKYPAHTHGGNFIQQYADVEAVRVLNENEFGAEILIREAYDHLKLPVAITECHLHCTREEQMRWFYQMWQTVTRLKNEGVDIRAITAWAILGSYGWNTLVTQPNGDYEPGVFNLGNGQLRPTAMARLIRELCSSNNYQHAVLHNQGWWQRDSRIHYAGSNVINMKPRRRAVACQPLLICSDGGLLSRQFIRCCRERNIHFAEVHYKTFDTLNSYLEILQEHNPWAVVNTVEYSNAHHAEKEFSACFHLNVQLPQNLARVCNSRNIKYLAFSSDLVFDGAKGAPYYENDQVNPITVYGRSKAAGEEVVFRSNPTALVIRTGPLFGPGDRGNVIDRVLNSLRQGKAIPASDQVFFSATYAPDLVTSVLDMLLDDEQGIVHVANRSVMSEAAMLRKLAELHGTDQGLIRCSENRQFYLNTIRSGSTLLESSTGITLPALEDALARYIADNTNKYPSLAVAV